MGEAIVVKSIEYTPHQYIAGAIGGVNRIAIGIETSNTFIDLPNFQINMKCGNLRNFRAEFKYGLFPVAINGTYIYFEDDNYPKERIIQNVCVSKGKWGYINTKGEVVIQFQYESATEFYKGYALVNESMLINPQGQIVRKNIGRICYYGGENELVLAEKDTHKRLCFDLRSSADIYVLEEELHNESYLKESRHSIADELTKYIALRDSGELTFEEFEILKKKLIHQ